MTQHEFRIGCKGSENPQMCLNCKRAECVLEKKKSGAFKQLPPDDCKALGAKMRQWRKAHNMSCESVAAMLGHPEKPCGIGNTDTMCRESWKK